MSSVYSQLFASHIKKRFRRMNVEYVHIFRSVKSELTIEYEV